MALWLVFSILLLLMTFGGMLRLMLHGATVEVDALADHLQAVAAAEEAYANVVARLSRTAWDRRWFQAGPEIVEDVAVSSGGSYSYVLRDAPVVGGEESGRADLLVRSRHEKSTVTMFWRLAVPRRSLESVMRIVPVLYGHAPDTTPLTPVALDPLSRDIQDQVARRDNNRTRFETRRAALEGSGSVTDAGTLIGADPGSQVLTGTASADGSSSDISQPEPPPSIPPQDLEPRPPNPTQEVIDLLRNFWDVTDPALIDRIWQVYIQTPHVVDEHQLVPIERLGNAAYEVLMRDGPTEPGLTIKGGTYAQVATMQSALGGLPPGTPMNARLRSFQLASVRLTRGGQIGPVVKVGEIVSVSGPMEPGGWCPAEFAGVRGWIQAGYLEPAP